MFVDVPRQSGYGTRKDVNPFVTWLTPHHFPHESCYFEVTDVTGTCHIVIPARIKDSDMFSALVQHLFI